MKLVSLLMVALVGFAQQPVTKVDPTVVQFESDMVIEYFQTQAKIAATALENAKANESAKVVIEKMRTFCADKKGQILLDDKQKPFCKVEVAKVPSKETN